MSNGKKQNIYLLVTNHNSLKGCWEQYIITKRTFTYSEDFNLNLSPTIVPNEINIIIEEFNDELVSFMKKVKGSYPKTKYILYVTEYLTPSNLFGFQLNTFSFAEKLLHGYISFLSRYKFTELYTHPRKVFSSRLAFIKKIKYKIKNLISKVTCSPILKIYGEDAFFNTIMITRRERALNRAKRLFSLCISTTEAVLYSYSEYCDCKLAYLPVFIDLEKSKAARKGRKYVKASFFSGRVSKYRSLVIKEFNKLNDAFPLKKLGAHKTSKYDIHQNKLYLDALVKLRESPFATYDNFDYFDSSFFQFNSINEVRKNIRTPLYEIYIPQLKSWPYSSPNRTMLSIEQGYIPVNLGIFTDHDINKYTKQCIDIYTLQSEVQTKKIEESFKELDKKINEYNETQKVKFENFIDIFKCEVCNETIIKSHNKRNVKSNIQNQK